MNKNGDGAKDLTNSQLEGNLLFCRRLRQLHDLTVDAFILQLCCFVFVFFHVFYVYA